MVKNPFEYASGKKVNIMAEQRQQIRKMYYDLYSDVVKELHYLKRSTGEYATERKSYLKTLKRDLADMVKAVDRETEVVINKNMDMAVQAVLQNNQMYLSGLGYREVINNNVIKQDVLNRITTGQIYGEKWSLSKAIWGDSQAKIAEINKVISQGVLQGKNFDEIAKSIQRYIDPNVRLPSGINGVRNNIDWRAQRLAKTEVQHAYQEAFVAATRLNPFIDAYRWITSGGSNVCPLCIERANTDKYGLGEGIFPKDRLPLDHPNGNCTFEVVVTMSDDEISDAIADWYLGEGDPGLNKKLDIFAESLINP